MSLSLRMVMGFLCATCMLVFPARLCALEADQLALVVNRNMPEGEKLAEFYAKARSVPDHRIIELDLPTTEEMSFEQYERDVVPPIRQFLRFHDPDHKIKCLVTFYGVPLRIAAHVATPEEITEIKRLQIELQAIETALTPIVQDTEKLAAEVDKSFKPVTTSAANSQVIGQGVDDLMHRTDAAGKSINLAIQREPDAKQQQVLAQRMLQLAQRFSAPVEVSDAPGPGSAPGSAPAIDNPPATTQAMDHPDDRRFEAAGRLEIRKRAGKFAGLFGYAKMLISQIGYLSPDESGAATDSELSLLWWTYYPRPRWQMNTLSYRFAGGSTSPALMVSRLDAPDPTIVRSMILASIRAEEQGLQGRVVIDSQGLRDPANSREGPYMPYDQMLRNLAALVKAKTTLPLLLDEKHDVLPVNSAADVALYCGWYSVGKYVPACSFVPGAVGYHMASFELVSLRNNANTGWVRGLLKDGVAASVGSVDEPFIQAFPQPDEFFPLLLTGRLTLAEVYWKTENFASWRMCLIGDPLYTPFKVHPALKVDDLPPRLQPIFAEPATRPTTAPATRPPNPPTTRP